MSKLLTPEQLETLRSVPLEVLAMSNKVRLAITITGVQQSDIVDATSLSASQVSNAATGRPTIVEVARDIARFFGCAVEDLWPASDAAVHLVGDRRSGTERRSA